jgi:hypothetical protein
VVASGRLRLSCWAPAWCDVFVFLFYFFPLSGPVGCLSGSLAWSLPLADSAGVGCNSFLPAMKVCFHLCPKKKPIGSYPALL